MFVVNCITSLLIKYYINEMRHNNDNNNNNNNNIDVQDWKPHCTYLYNITHKS